MRDNHGYTVPARWLADLDAVPDGDRWTEVWVPGWDRNSHGSNVVGAIAPQSTDARTRRRRHV